MTTSAHELSRNERGPAAARPPRLRIAILGAGRIGSAFAFQLARVGGHDVTVFARPGSPRLAQLEKDQAIVHVSGDRAKVQVAGALDETVAYDLLIVTVLAHQVEPLLPSLRRCAAACVQFMFNTFDPERLQVALGPERCAFGMPFVQATLDDAGRLKVAVRGTGRKTIMDRVRWVEVFAAAALPAALEPQMPHWLRCHAPLCVAFESVAVAGQRRRGGAAWTESLVLAQGVRASFSLIKALGYPIYPKAKQRLSVTPIWILATILWSMSRVRPFRELLATGHVEANELVGSMVSFSPPATSPELVARIMAMRPEALR